MDSATVSAPYSLHRVDEHHWLIHDDRVQPNDAAHLIGCIHIAADDDEVEVVWVQRIPLPTRYATANDVLDDLLIWAERPRGGARPVPIAHFAPTGPIGLPPDETSAARLPD